MSMTISAKERDAIIQALRAGIVPRLGIRHIQVGRIREINETVKDVNRIASGGSAVRFIIGDYGAGKTFFLTLARNIAAEKKLVVMNADLSPERKLQSTNGHARLLCAELIGSMATRTKPEGGALASIIERFLGFIFKEAESNGKEISNLIQERLETIREGVSGFDFANVITSYWKGFEDGNEVLKNAALRWLRAEYNLKSEATEALGVRSIIGDHNVYDHLKAVSRLIKLAGYEGTFIVIDEMVNLYKITNSLSRNNNYEQILRIVNDVLQGNAERIGFYFGGTPEFLENNRRGLFSYEALRSRLESNSFAKNDMIDLSGPVIKLQNLTPEEMLVLIEKLRLLWASGDEQNLPIPDEALTIFLAHCSQKIGDQYFKTPRNTIKEFLDLLAVLDQYPEKNWHQLLDKIELKPDQSDSIQNNNNTLEDTKPLSNDDNDLTTFQL